MKRSRRLVAALAGGIVLFALIFAGRLPVLTGSGADAPHAAMGYIDDTPVDQREFSLVLNQIKAQVASYFKMTYDADVTPAFWDTSYQGEVPLEKARQMALEQIKRVKAVQRLAQQNGLLDDPSYAAFLDNWAKENRRRAEAVKRNEVIYGPRQYDEWGYYTYLNTNMELKLKQLLYERGQPLPEQTLRNAYEAWKDTLYAEVGEIKTYKFETPYAAAASGEPRRSDKPDTKAKIEEIKRRLERGEDPEGIGRSLDSDAGAGWKVGEFVVNEDSLRSKDMHSPDQEAIEEALRLPENGVSEVFASGDRFVVLKCLERKGGGYRSFDNVKEDVTRRLFEEKFEMEVKKLTSEAKVTLEESVYRSMRLQ
ncbi:peptidylprolyl isomerase [Cohnella sp. GCM10012308]|uniref:peptidylprolyl isomerase n=1 Tax=Cohnella sp. GCM10012308 TaxID=3317329 RepID=UPI00361D875D